MFVVASNSTLFIAFRRSLSVIVLMSSVLLLDASSNIAIPTVLISSKCDNPRKAWQINQHMVEGICKTVDGVESFQISVNSPETHKRCVSVILRKIMSERAGEPERSPSLWILTKSLEIFTKVPHDKCPMSAFLK